MYLKERRKIMSISRKKGFYCSLITYNKSFTCRLRVIPVWLGFLCFVLPAVRNQYNGRKVFSPEPTLNYMHKQFFLSLCVFESFSIVCLTQFPIYLKYEK